MGMKLPEGFKPKKDLDGKIKELLKGEVKEKTIEDSSKVRTFKDAIKYLGGTRIPFFGYDDKKRIYQTDISLRDVFTYKLGVGRLNLNDKNAIRLKNLYFTQDPQFDFKIDASLDLGSYLSLADPEFKLTKDTVQEVIRFVEHLGKENWELSNLDHTAGFSFQGPLEIINMDIPKEIKWVFETFKDYNPTIHGGALRDTYLGLDITGDIDVQLKPTMWLGEKRLYRKIKKVMDKVHTAKKGKTISEYGWEEYRPLRYVAEKNGMTYDISGETFDRYLSTEQLMMRQPGKLIIYKLAKNDLDNKQFRIINMGDIPERIANKISKLEGLGLEFLPENPDNLAQKLDSYDLMKQVRPNGKKGTSWY